MLTQKIQNELENLKWQSSSSLDSSYLKSTYCGELREAAGEEEAEYFGAPKAGPGMWASLVRIIEPIQGNTLHTIRLEQNEAAFSICLVKFANQADPSQQFLLIGTVRDYHLSPRQVDKGIIYTYKVNSDCNNLEYVHKTEVEDIPTSMYPYNGRILIGIGKLLRIYDLGKKKLLRKCENKLLHIPNLIVDIKARGQRIFVSDVQESVFFIRYKRQENQLIIYMDDTHQRWVTTSCMLDYDTVSLADKFGNISIVRMGQDVSDDVDEDPTGNKALWDRGLLNGASQKAEIIANFHIGETVNSLEKATLIPGGSESLVYTNFKWICWCPRTIHVERRSRTVYESGNAHAIGTPSVMWSGSPLFQISFYKCWFRCDLQLVYNLNVIDGDLCEQFNMVDAAKQKSISEDLDKNAE
ncbi:Splicing factor 3B subunit 3 [Armadillidium nasatum]|uniref:Splicing factor 3B subunit 3 n=1 Tax=Armadillidium nasatum TaxID=96803 RepID=A0A5N5T1X7_9CRUS|nr:Splicing factor 3B subunit 3 [Armadillidium nasatum]